jgi:hypothetical protein
MIADIVMQEGAHPDLARMFYKWFQNPLSGSISVLD